MKFIFHYYYLLRMFNLSENPDTYLMALTQTFLSTLFLTC